MALLDDNRGKHIDYIVSTTDCTRHEAPQGSACWYIKYDKGRGELGSAVCGVRIRSAGFNGKIQPHSLQQYRDGKLTKRRR